MSTVTNQSFWEKTSSPVFQAAYAFGGMIVIIALSAIARAMGVMVPITFPWLAAAAFLLLFALFNSILALSAKSMPKYWGRSIYCFLGLAAGAAGIAWLTSSVSINEAGSYRWIYIVVTIGYLVFLSLITMMRKIVEFAQREEWNHPRIRRGRNRNPRDRHIK